MKAFDWEISGEDRYLIGTLLFTHRTFHYVASLALAELPLVWSGVGYRVVYASVQPTPKAEGPVCGACHRRLLSTGGLGARTDGVWSAFGKLCLSYVCLKTVRVFCGYYFAGQQQHQQQCSCVRRFA